MPESVSGLVCGACRQRPAFPPVAAPRAHEGVARALVLALKAGRRPEIAETLARATAADARVEAALSSADLIVPVPAHPLRRRERGYDQAELIARELGRQALPGRRRPRVARLLRRSAGEPPQSGRGRSARRRGPARSLRPAWLAQRRARGRRIVLVDDVVTTGASLRAAGRLLQRLGAVDVCAVAVTRTGRDR
jgi:ComF family protein